MPRRIPLFTLALAVIAITVTPAVRTAGQGDGPWRIRKFAPDQLRQWDRELARMERAGDLKLVRVQQDTLVPGRRFERLAQAHDGIPIWGSELVRETDGATTFSITGELHGHLAVDTTPTLTPSAAQAIAEAAIGTPAPPDLRPALVILPTADGRYVLAYQLSWRSETELPVLFVNAKTGVIEFRYNNLQTIAAVGRGRGVLGDEKKVSASSRSGTFVAYDELRPSHVYTLDLKGDYQRAEDLQDRRISYTWSDVATDADNDWTDAAAVDAHVHLGWTYDYFFKRFGRKGLNGQDGPPIQVLVHSVRREDLARYDWAQVGNYFVNAWFCTRCASNGSDLLVLGEGLPPGYYISGTGQYVDYMSAALDIVAHEYSHGVTSYTSNLIYINDSGALNEAFSDVMSVGAEFYFQPAGSGVMKADYLEGEDAWRPSRPGSLSGIRSLSDPRSQGDPDHYSQRYVGDLDNGGVHINCTIAGQAFYLAVEGGQNRTSGLSVQGVGAGNREQIEKVFYRGFTSLPMGATFHDARVQTIDSARVLYGAGSAAERAMTQAWDAVGVS